MASSHYGELSVTVQMCRNLHLPEIGGSLLSKRFTPYVSLALDDAAPLPSSTTNTLQTSLGPPGTPKPTFAQTLTFPATTLTTENTTLTCSLMSSLRFGADATVSTCTIPITSAILKAGRKGTLFNWYKLDSPSTDNADALPVAGEVSLSFRFKPFNPPSPVRTKPIALERPWYLTLEGLYMGGKGAWQSALSSDRYLVKPTLTYLDGAVTTTLTHYKTSRGCLDTIITSKLASADDSIDAALPKIWDHVPLKGKLAIDVPLTCDHATVVPTVLFPEDSPTRMIAECHETLTDYVDRKMPRKPASTTKTSAYSLGYPNIVLPAVGVPYFGNSRKAPH